MAKSFDWNFTVQSSYKMSHYTFNALLATALWAANLAKHTDPIKYSLKSTTPWFSYKIRHNIT